MHVLVDGYNLALEKGTGVATYARNLTGCLQREGYDVSVLYGVRGAPYKAHLMREVSFFDSAVAGKRGQIRLMAEALLNPLSRSAYEVKLSGAVIHRQFASQLPYHDTLWNSPDIFELAHRRFRFHRKRLTVKTPKNISVAHWTYPLPIKHETARNIYTLHDLVPLRLPYTTLDNKNFYYKLVSLIANKADHIVTVSENSKKDIVNLLGVDPDRVTNTYQSVDIPEEYLRLKEDVLRSNLFGSFGLEYKSYLLFFGSIEPKKNVGRILEAYLAANIDMPLVIVGAQAWSSKREQQLLMALGSQATLGGQGPRKVLHLDYVSFQLLIILIRGARAVVFPSLYEGFGLPILEGMLCETAVITSNFGSMREVADDACLLVDPYNTYEIKDAMIAAAANSDLCSKMVARGRVVAERFSPDAHQRRLAKVYAKLTATQDAGIRTQVKAA